MKMQDWTEQKKSSLSNQDNIVNHMEAANHSLHPPFGQQLHLERHPMLQVASKGNFLEVTGQIFTFQFPGQFLQQDVYADTSAWIVRQTYRRQ